MITLDLQQLPQVEVITPDRQVEALLRRDQKLADLAKPNNALDVARDAGADLAVTGAIMRDGASRLRIEVRAQDTSGGRAKTFTLDTTGGADIVKVVDAMARRLAGDLQLATG